MGQQFTLEEIAKLSGSKLIGDPQMFVSGVADLESADKTKVSFLANRRYLSAMLKSNAGAIFVKEDIPLYDHKNFLIHSDPSFAFQKVIELFHYDKLQKSAFTSIHPTCVIAPSAIISPNVILGPFVVVEEGAIIGQSSFITSHTYIGPNVHIGCNCYIYSNVTIRENCKIGNRVIIQPGTTIGSCGFGYSTDEKGEHKKLEQIGNVVVEDDVEIGANCAIDRGRFSETRIKKGSKIDNLVQIAHNVEIGFNNLIVSQSGIAGSSKTGRNVVMAGQAALVGHIKIADGTIIAARGAASKSVDQPGGKFAGAPMIPLAEHNKNSVYLRNIEKYVKKIETLEKKLTELELQSLS